MSQLTTKTKPNLTIQMVSYLVREKHMFTIINITYIKFIHEYF